MSAIKSKTTINKDDDVEDVGNEIHLVKQSPQHSATERTPLLISAPSVESINNPLQEKLQFKRQKLIYSSITLADIFQKVVHTTFTTSFLLFVYTYLGLDSKHSLTAYYLFGVASALLACFVNSNIEYFMSRQNAIVAGFMIYFTGLGGMSAFTAHVVSTSQSYLQYLVILPLFFICIGDAICKSCISDFTHSQFEDQSLSEQLSHYLIRLFWIGHIGALLLILMFLAIVEFTKFKLAYGLTCICLLAGLLSFITAWNKYEVYGRNKSSVLKMVYSIIFSARRKQLLHVKEEQR